MRRWRLMLGIALITAPVVLLIYGLATLAVVVFGEVRVDFSDLVNTVMLSLAGATGAAVGALILAGRNPGWVSVSADGLEFAAPRHRAAFVPWTAVRSVRLRRAALFTQLVVTPTGPGAAFFAQTSGRIPPLRKGAFLIDVALMTPGRAALQAELDRHRTALTVRQ
jgi:hypothetical protein